MSKQDLAAWAAKLQFEEEATKTQPDSDEHWPAFDSLDVDDMHLVGPIVFKSPQGVVSQTYLGLTSSMDAVTNWTGPKDCSNEDPDAIKYTCTGTFIGWVAFDEGGDKQVQQAWLIRRVRTPDVI